MVVVENEVFGVRDTVYMHLVALRIIERLERILQMCVPRRLNDIFFGAN